MHSSSITYHPSQEMIVEDIITRWTPPRFCTMICCHFIIKWTLAPEILPFWKYGILRKHRSARNFSEVKNQMYLGMKIFRFPPTNYLFYFFVKMTDWLGVIFSTLWGHNMTTNSIMHKNQSTVHSLKLKKYVKFGRNLWVRARRRYAFTTFFRFLVSSLFWCLYLISRWYMIYWYMI
jgi:hypothetical protein